jgi:hypothetical protein
MEDKSSASRGGAVLGESRIKVEWRHQPLALQVQYVYEKPWEVAEGTDSYP